LLGKYESPWSNGRQSKYKGTVESSHSVTHTMDSSLRKIVNGPTNLVGPGSLTKDLIRMRQRYTSLMDETGGTRLKHSSAFFYLSRLLLSAGPAEALERKV
jgi:hypothetical protein